VEVIFFNGYADGGLTASGAKHLLKIPLFESTPEIYKDVYQIPFSQSTTGWLKMADFTSSASSRALNAASGGAQG
jgi:hypothetical protein